MACVSAFGFEAEQVLPCGQPCAGDAECGDDAADGQPFPCVEKTPFDVEAVGAENLCHQGLGGVYQPGAQCKAQTCGQEALPDGLIEEGAADEGGRRA